jgi:hypothetical protein
MQTTAKIIFLQETREHFIDGNCSPMIMIFAPILSFIYLNFMVESFKR